MTKMTKAGAARGARNPKYMERGASTAVESNVAYRLRKVSDYVRLSGDWLDCGCADGGYTRALLQAGAASVIGTDVERRRIDAATERWPGLLGLSFIVAAAEQLPFDDETFDGVFLNEVLEHVDDEARTLNEIRRVLRPGGSLVLMSPSRIFPFEGHGLRVGGRKLDLPIPFLPWLPGRLTQRYMRARNYWPRELRRLVESSGLAIAAIDSVMPVFEVYPWLPNRLRHWYWSNLSRIEGAPLFRSLGVSTMIVARKVSERRDDHLAS